MLHALMNADRFLIWDFDGTLAFRPGNWTGVVCDVVAAERPDVGMTPARLRPHLQSGFPWHTPDVVRIPCSADQWWSDLLSVLATAVQAVTGLDTSEARRLVDGVRMAYTDATGWQIFDDALPVLTTLHNRGWSHLVLSNHMPELPQLVDALGLSDVIMAVYSSGCTGAEKPHRKAFEAVFAGHPGARRGWMIGDSWRADVQGALAVGLRAILVRSEHPEATLHCKTLREVVSVVDGV
jgi:putative hydrolase of the HAD superfamily